MLRMPASALTRRALLGGAAVAAGAGLGHRVWGAPTGRALPAGFMKGMTVSCPGYGQIWGSETMRSTLAELSTLGVAWTAVHPYAGVDRSGRIRAHPAEETGYLPACTRIAADAGHHLFWKPHLAYWGSFSWRGDIHFEDPAAWDRFFTGYREFIVDQARFAEARKLPLFAVGVEYKRTLQHEARWREIIAAVRKVYRGPITYAANWDEVEHVPFWDAVDLIGVQFYFPLSVEADPPMTALVAAWDAPLARLAAASRAHGGRPVVLTEIGYARSMKAAREPWQPDVDGSAGAIDLRSKLLAAALARVSSAPHIRGAFWWKWIPGHDGWDRDFSMKDPEARAALAAHWKV
ncbi:MAG: hypothetical protein H6730_09385 [Deltaproteobacteria bacterium]|nr:hypothetical protein [Deltaproteobacteria bacterium]